MIYQSLEQAHLVDFGRASDEIRGFLSEGRTMLPAQSDAVQAVADLIHLNAAEATLLVPLPEGARLFREPLLVTVDAARFAISATDSGPFIGHDPRQRPRLWDVTLLGGDASKLAWLGGTDSVDVLRDRFDDVIARLASLYHEREDPAGYGNPEAFSLRATLWRAKIAVLLEEREAPIWPTPPSFA